MNDKMTSHSVAVSAQRAAQILVHQARLKLVLKPHLRLPGWGLRFLDRPVHDAYMHLHRSEMQSRIEAGDLTGGFETPYREVTFGFGMMRRCNGCNSLR